MAKKKKSLSKFGTFYKWANENILKFLFLSFLVLVVLIAGFSELVYKPLTYRHLENLINEVEIPDEWEFVSESRSGVVNCDFNNCLYVVKGYKTDKEVIPEDVVFSGIEVESNNCPEVITKEVLDGTKFCSLSTIKGNVQLAVIFFNENDKINIGVRAEKTSSLLDFSVF